MSGASHSGLRESRNLSCGYFPSLECIVRIDTPTNWQNPYTDSWAIIVGMVTWKPLELPLPTKIVNLSIIGFLEGLQRLVLPLRS